MNVTSAFYFSFYSFTPAHTWSRRKYTLTLYLCSYRLICVYIPRYILTSLTIWGIIIIIIQAQNIKRTQLTITKRECRCVNVWQKKKENVVTMVGKAVYFLIRVIKSCIYMHTHILLDDYSTSQMPGVYVVYMTLAIIPNTNWRHHILVLGFVRGMAWVARGC